MIRDANIPISVVVPVKNEEVNLDRCLSRLSRFEEVVVVDSSSEDRTPEIAEARGAKLLNFEWDGHFPKKRNWVLTSHQLACEWVLFLDADEIVDKAFCDAVARAVERGEHHGFWLNYTNYFLGKPLRHGIAQRKLALFRVGAGLYERIDEDEWSSLDMEIHEHPLIEGSIGELAERVDHNDDRGIAKFLDRHRDYAAWGAHRVAALHAGNEEAWGKLTKRQRFKYKNLHRRWYPAFYFLAHYVAKRGFLDGHAGFQYAFYKFWYFNTIRLLIREKQSESSAIHALA